MNSAGAVQIDHAIILGSRDFRDSDALVTFYAKNHGKLTGVARGAKRSQKRFAGGLEKGAEVLAHFVLKPTSQLATLKEIEVINGHLPLRNQIASLSAATYVEELILLATHEGEGNEPLYELICQTLELLETRPEAILIRAFEVKLLHHLGYQPLLDRCVICQTPLFPLQQAIFGFSLQGGGLLCEKCERNQPALHHLTPHSLLLLKELQEQELRESIGEPSSREVMVNLDAVLPAFVSYRLEKPLRSLPFLRSIFK